MTRRCLAEFFIVQCTLSVDEEEQNTWHITATRLIKKKIGQSKMFDTKQQQRIIFLVLKRSIDQLLKKNQRPLDLLRKK